MGNRFSLIALLKIILTEQPEVQVQTSEEISVMAGDTITLSCDAIGYPPPFVTWRKNLMPLRQNSRYNFTSQNGFAVLRIRDAGLEDSGEYHCEIISDLHGSRLVQPSTRVQVSDGKYHFGCIYSESS